LGEEKSRVLAPQKGTIRTPRSGRPVVLPLKMKTDPWKANPNCGTGKNDEKGPTLLEDPPSKKCKVPPQRGKGFYPPTTNFWQKKLGVGKNSQPKKKPFKKEKPPRTQGLEKQVKMWEKRSKKKKRKWGKRKKKKTGTHCRDLSLLPDKRTSENFKKT